MNPAASFPVMLRLDGRRVLVVGAGPVAARKIGALRTCGADVTVIAPHVVDEVRRMPVAIVERRYSAGDVRDFMFVVVSTNDAAVQQQVFDECEAAGIWCNAADDPERCSATLPAVVRRGVISVAVATEGSSPALAGVLRDRVDAVIPQCSEQLGNHLAVTRRMMKSAGLSTEAVDWKPMIRGLLDAGLEPLDRSGAATFRLLPPDSPQWNRLAYARGGYTVEVELDHTSGYATITGAESGDLDVLRDWLAAQRLTLKA